MWQRGYSFPEDSGTPAIGKTPDGGFVLVGSTFLTGRRSGYAVKINGTGDVEWMSSLPLSGAGFDSVALIADGGFLNGRRCVAKSDDWCAQLMMCM